jgi:hypothetical protein
LFLNSNFETLFFDICDKWLLKINYVSKLEF